MTQLQTTETASETSHAAETAQRFFDLYNQQDVSAMITLFEPQATIEYVPFALKGPVEEIGPGSWGVLIDSFPDLNNTVNSITVSDDHKSVFIDVNIAGTQEKEAFGVPSLGNSYDLRHLFIMTIAESGKISGIICFWDNANWYTQLGKTTL